MVRQAYELKAVAANFIVAESHILRLHDDVFRRERTVDRLGLLVVRTCLLGIEA